MEQIFKCKAYCKTQNRIWTWEEIWSDLDEQRPAMYFRALIGGKLENFILLLYTTLNDCNAYEIYDGDILAESEHTRIKWLVVWEQAGWRLKPYFDGAEGANSVTFFPGLQIIGNKYTNPEMLKYEV